ncbi:PQQ-dependent sugar dehydrogenase [Bauldia sp.]|uniref:PQQ-dependent sugar dehydrogenase n=1 Tax=Bauldia sp. TaxID=2575872 RepID=UPI003BA95849
MAATNGDDILKGTSGADTIKGKKGDDVIFGYDGDQTGDGVGAIDAVLVGSGFGGALFAASAPGRPDELFVVQKNSGEIDILDPDTGQFTPFLDIDGLSTSGEQGLLGLAFHPDYETNGLFYVHLTNAVGDIEIREYARDELDPDSASFSRLILEVPHPDATNHNGGSMAFGPDGYLYIALGDGGADANTAQDKDDLLGSILRIDVDNTDPGKEYAIPTGPDGNPFVGEPGEDEIWAWGLRNPWRISFDKDGNLFIADVGQNSREEINFQPASSDGGENYGWPGAEGTLGTPPPGAVAPVFEYSHDLGRSVTGGYVYDAPGQALDGAYFFADFITGRLWTLVMDGGVATEVVDRTSQVISPDAAISQIASFGVDGNGNLYLVSLSGNIFRLDPAEHADDLADILKGGRGSDKIYGGPGDDELVGGRNADVLKGGFGEDTLKGGKGGDKVRGGAGDDEISGGKGNDDLGGDDGADWFRFDTKLDPDSNVDRIRDFETDVDLIVLDGSVFTKIGSVLGGGEFHIGKKAADGNDRIIYNDDNGKLFHDENGAGAGKKTLFAKLDAGLSLDADDFLMA